MHAAHVIAALVFFALSGLSSSLATIGSIGLGAIWLLRVPSTMALNVALLRMPMTWLGIAWTAWAALGGLWTASPEQWRSQLGAWRVVLVIPALWPVIRWWHVWAVGLIAGVNLQNVVQVLQQAQLYPPHHASPVRHPGLASHPGHVATWTGVAVLLLIAASAILPRRWRNWLAASMALALLGIAIAAARGATVALAVAAPATLAAIAWNWSPRAALRATAPLAMAIVAGALLAGAVTLGGSDWENVRRQLVQLTRDPRPDDAVGQRLVWWSAARELWRLHPVRGAGLGGYAAWMPHAPSVVAAAASTSQEQRVLGALKVEHPHSVALHALCDLGLVGAALAGAIAAGTLLGAWRLAQRDPLGCGILGAAILWIVAAQFESLHLNGMTGALGAAIVAIAMLATRGGDPLPRRDPDLRSPAA